MKKQLLLALFIVAGLVAVFAFKQEQTPKKYLTLSFLSGQWITIVDEQGASQSLELKLNNANANKWIENSQVPLTTKLNELSAKGYRLIEVSTSGNLATFIFEKE